MIGVEAIEVCILCETFSAERADVLRLATVYYFILFSQVFSRFLLGIDVPKYLYTHWIG